MILLSAWRATKRMRKVALIPQCTHSRECSAITDAEWASSVVIAHCHPSGNSTWQQKERNLKRKDVLKHYNLWMLKSAWKDIIAVSKRMSLGELVRKIDVNFIE